jgi:cytosine/uracil/thiamine/allantoin permease
MSILNIPDLCLHSRRYTSTHVACFIVVVLALSIFCTIAVPTNVSKKSLNP